MAVVVTELQKHPMFHGKVHVNLITAPYPDGMFDPTLLKGQLELDEYKHHLPIIWIYCDDFLKEYLGTSPCDISHPPDPLVIATTWGDGSGTGTKGTF
eukprot:9038135-Ditylum_brightwellii.AAC.1